MRFFCAGHQSYMNLHFLHNSCFAFLMVERGYWWQKRLMNPLRNRLGIRFEFSVTVDSCTEPHALRGSTQGFEWGKKELEGIERVSVLSAGG